MEIYKKLTGESLEVKITGRIDTNTSVQFREEVADKLEGVTNLRINLDGVTYVSSAGLRVLIACHKSMDDRGEMVICNVSPELMKILKATGMLELFNVERCPKS